MTISVKKTTEEEITIDLPYYCSSKWFAFAVVDENKAIQVHCGVDKTTASIDIVHAKLPFEAKLDCTVCTADEFKAFYNDALVRIDAFLNLPSLPEIQY